jgi:6,7-dimethyl-8-ribityllumazine synthase
MGKIAMVVSRFNEPITQALYEGAYARLLEHGIAQDSIATVWVPGAVEIPLIVQQCAKQADTVAVIALGAVIRGETSHFDYVCQQVSYGCQKVALTHEIPVIFGVLTTETEEQAWQRLGGGEGHKGRDAADTALAMIAVMGKWRSG